MSEANHSLRELVYASLQQEGTEELLGIWKQNDREGWTDIAFEAIHDILMERLGSVPEQGVDEALGTAESVEELDTYHDPGLLAGISTQAGVVARVVLIASIVIWVTSLVRYSLMAGQLLAAGLNVGELVFLAVSSAFTLLTGAFYFVVLRFISEAGYILMDIEDNTRGRNGRSRQKTSIEKGTLSARDEEPA